MLRSPRIELREQRPRTRVADERRMLSAVTGQVEVLDTPAHEPGHHLAALPGQRTHRAGARRKRRARLRLADNTRKRRLLSRDDARERWAGQPSAGPDEIEKRLRDRYRRRDDAANAPRADAGHGHDQR